MGNYLKDINYASTLPPTQAFSKIPLYHLRGLLLAQMGQLENSFQNLVEARRRNPEALNVHVNLWKSSAQLQKYGYTLYLSREMMRLQPDHSGANRMYALSLSQSGKSSEALAIIKKAVNLKPTNSYIWSEIARIQLKLGNYSEALNDYEKALEFKPDHINTQIRLAFLLATCPESTIRDGERAVEYATYCIMRLRSSPQRAYAKMVLAMSYAEIGQADKATKLATESIKEAKLDANVEKKWNQLIKQFKSGHAYRHSVSKSENQLFVISPLMNFHLSLKKKYKSRVLQ
ncbi:MAG: tetratricopeptide repeat protein [Planctomycetes bacterium]|nr:tetratricopeptide repeat protein [Planctomycetota bacterium]